MLVEETLGLLPGGPFSPNLLSVHIGRRTVYALAGAGAEEMVLFTPS